MHNKYNYLMNTIKDATYIKSISDYELKLIRFMEESEERQQNNTIRCEDLEKL